MLLQLGLIIATPCQALPFFQASFQTRILVPDKKTLEQQLQSFIQRQQSTNQQLKQIKNKSKYTKLLSAILRKKLKSLGYYDFGLSFENQRQVITFAIQPGPRAIINKVKVTSPEFVLDNLTEIAQSNGLQQGEALLASQVLKAQAALQSFIHEHYCFVDPILKRSVMLNTANQQVDVSFELETQPGKEIKLVEFKGNTTIRSAFLAHITRIQPGCFKSEMMTKAQIALLQTGLLTSATPEVVPLNQDQVKIVFQVTERKHRTQKVGIGYASDEGARLNFGWEHRNWRGNAKRLTTEFQVSQLKTQIDGTLRVPQFKHSNLDLLLQSELSSTSLEAFDAVNAQTSAILEYSLGRHWIISFGVATQYSKINSSEQNDIFRLFSLPVSLRWDKSNDLLDPTKGHIWTFAVQPFTDVINNNIQFTQFATSLQLYYSPRFWGLGNKKQKPLTIATRFATGSIQGEDLQAVPADQRYYVGGGGSVRGFEYQSLSPQSNGIIRGGLSFIEVATELRLRFANQWGASVFVDGGTGSIEQSPDISAQLNLGGGIGIRYTTSFAPIRLDIAWPLSSTNEIENKAQLYVGLKQAF